MQASASSQLVPFSLGVARQAPVVALQVPTLHASLRPEQSTGVPAWHVRVCRLHTSTPLQGFLSLHCALVVQAQLPELETQPPSASEQLSAVQATSSSQFLAVPWHLPATQASAAVHSLPSSQLAPSAFCGLLQAPVAGPGGRVCTATTNWWSCLGSNARPPQRRPPQ